MADRRRLIVELVEQHYEAVYRAAYRLSGNAQDAAELVQETFCRAHERLEQLKDPSRARAWLLTILRNLYMQRRRRPQPVGLDHPERLADPRPDSEPEASEIDSATLQAALDRLPDEFKLPLVLYYFGEHSYREIAEILGVPVGTVMSRLSRAKAKLRTLLGLASAHSHREV